MKHNIPSHNKITNSTKNPRQLIKKLPIMDWEL